MTQFMKFLIIVFLNLLFYNYLHAQNIIRARDIGIPLDGITGKFNSIPNAHIACIAPLGF